jgi:hypothetical protein
MEILKSSLKQVPEAERVKGRVYGVADECRNEINFFAIYNDGDSDVHGREWVFWFELPESMLPTREVEVMPEVGKDYEFSDDGVKWFRCELDLFTDVHGYVFKRIRPIQFNPAQTLSIPAGTKAEQVEFLRGVIATMEGGGV